MTPYSKALVLGCGASGLAAAGLLTSEGARVTVVDEADNDGLAARAQPMKDRGVEIILGAADLPGGTFDVCIASPGIPVDSAWIRSAHSRGMEVVSELELGASRCQCPIIGITGSNGKSTLVKLCGESLTAAGMRVDMAGNYGTPLSAFAMKSGNYDWGVAEVSSFQLETARAFKPRVGVLLNVNPNHLNRHGEMATYAKIKNRLFACMGQDDTGVVPDAKLNEVRSATPGRNRWVSFGLSDRADYRYEDGAVRYRHGVRKDTVSVVGTLFANDVMGTTAAAAVAVADACGQEGRCVETAASAFKPLPHRMNRLATIRGVRFVDDSKATNVAAMMAALKMCDEPVRLIAGGQLKETDLADAGKALAEKTVGIYLIGEAAGTLADAWGRIAPCRICERLDRAVREAWKDAKPGEVILLSPACASFDQFGSFEERGSRFVELVGTLSKER
jgi:UDP-N-acetylmuramoylalanine--D-glutamate ligase